MVTWFKSFCPTACRILAGGSVFSVNSGTLSDSKKLLFLYTIIFMCLLSWSGGGGGGGSRRKRTG